MTIATVNSSISYNGDGTSTLLPIPFKFFANSHIIVNSIVLATGVVTGPLVQGSAYTITGNGSVGSASVQMAAPAPAGTAILIERIVPLVQTLDLVPNDRFPADSVEQQLDYLTMALQQLQDIVTGNIIVGGAGAGITSIQNIGTGVGVFATLTGAIAQFKSLKVGPNLGISSDATSITLTNTMSLAGVLLAANNLSDVANRQTALNNLTAAAGGGNEFVLTKDTASGSAMWKVVPTGGGAGEANTMSSAGGGASIVLPKVGVDLPVRSFIAGPNMTITQNASDITLGALGEANSATNIGVAGAGLFAGKSGATLQFKGLAGGLGISVAANATDVTHSINQAASLAWTGQEKFLGAFAEASIPADAQFQPVNQYAVKVSRTAPAGGANTDQVAMLLVERVAANTTSFEWVQAIVLDNFANTQFTPTAGPPAIYPQNVGSYIKAYKRARGPTWGACFEAQDFSGDAGSPLFGLEIDLCFAGVDNSGTKRGIAIYYGDAAPNTRDPAGASTKVGVGIEIAPFQPRNQMRAGYAVNGTVDYGFLSSTNLAPNPAPGISAFAANGRYSGPIIELGLATYSGIAMTIGAGAVVKFLSGISGNQIPPANPAPGWDIPAGTLAGTPTWYAGSFVPGWVGALRILVDTSTLYIPVCSNHP